MDYKKTALKLISIKGLGSRRILQLSNQLDNINDLFEKPLKELEYQGLINKEQKKLLQKKYDENFVSNTLDILSKSPFELITIFDDTYPELLKKIYDPPAVLFTNGTILPEDHDAIAVVGTRLATNYGKQVVDKLVRELVRNNFTIISGMARGIDTHAHRAALKYGGRTLAVLGNGVDIVYPRENRSLRNDILKNGCCISEFPFGTRPNAPNFPKRNRVISGLSLGTIVIEAGKKSGAVLTAYDALDQNREVFAVPGRIDDNMSAGTNKLIQKGAKLVSGIDSILEEIDNRRRFYQKEKQLTLNLNISKDERQIVELLSDNLHVDQIAVHLNKNVPEVLSTLLSLEIKGLVKQYPGKIFGRME